MINLIVAVSKNGVIGKDNTLPWRIPEDLKAFKELTMGGVLFVGKNTAQSLPPLKGREIIQLKRETFIDVLQTDYNDRLKWIIGGATIYNAALELNLCDKVYLTLIDKEYDGDTFFSHKQFALPNWKLVNERILKEQEPKVVLQEWEKVK